MKKVVKLTESDLEKLVQRILEEEGGNQPDFLFKTEYNPNDKSITASYYLLGENDRTWDLLNIQEKERMSAVWGDDAKVYTYQPVVFKLPKSQALMVEEIGNTGYFIFKIPYWLYKKEPKMSVRRLEGKKRFVQPDIKGIEDVVPYEVLEPAMLAIGSDMKKLKGMKVALDDYKNPKTPIKPEDKPGYVPSPFGDIKKFDQMDLKESRWYNDYDEFDYSDVFLTVFKQWLKDNHPEAPSKAPLSYFFKKYGKEFADFYEIGLSFKPYHMGRSLVEKGVITLGSMRPEHKFTEKYQKGIDWIKSQFENDYTDIEIREDEPYTLDVTLTYDIPKFFKSDDKDVYSRDQKNAFENFLKTYFGVELGSPELGEIQVNFNTIKKDEETWIKKEFAKLKKEIRVEFPSIQRIMIKTNRNSLTPQVNFYRDYSHPDYRKANKDNTKEFFQKKGYGEGLTREFRVS
jgi:hypothetical protein